MSVGQYRKCPMQHRRWLRRRIRRGKRSFAASPDANKEENR